MRYTRIFLLLSAIMIFTVSCSNKQETIEATEMQPKIQSSNNITTTKQSTTITSTVTEAESKQEQVLSFKPVKIYEYSGYQIGLMFGHTSTPLYGETEIFYNEFINETYCYYNNNSQLEFPKYNYSIDEAVKFPEDIPYGTIATYEGIVKYIDTTKDTSGIRYDYMEVEVNSNISGHSPITLYAYIYQSEITKINNVYNYHPLDNIFVTGWLTSEVLIGNNGNLLPVMYIDFISYCPSWLNGIKRQAVRDTHSQMCYILNRTEIDVCYDNNDYELSYTLTLNEDWIAYAFSFGETGDCPFVRIQNKKTGDYSSISLDELNTDNEYIEKFTYSRSEIERIIEKSKLSD